MFKLQHWPGANNDLIVGLVATLIVLIIALIKYFKAKGDFYIGIFKRIAIIGILGLFFFCISDLTIVKFQYRNHPDCIKAYEMYQNNPNEVLRQKLNVEYLKASMSKEEFDMYQTGRKNKIK